MDYVKLVFTFIGKTELNKSIIDLLWVLLGSLCKNGQILNNYELIKCGNEFHAYLTLPEKDSLSKIYNNKYINEDLSKIKNIFDFRMEYIGENINFGTSCSCKSSSWYMLYTDWTSTESPVVCSDCGKEVPIHKLPYLPERYEHIDIINWQIAYKSIDNIWLHCLSDRFSYRQMNNAV